MSPNLSKSRFVSGWQCHKQLWLRVHETDAPELQINVVLQDRFDQGAEVGVLARERFPGGVLIGLHHDDPGRVGATRQALESGAPAVFEATFVENRVYVAIDVLERTPDGFTLIEVKSSSKVKDEHIPDVNRVLDLPEGFKLSEIQRRQHKALHTDRMIVEPGLREALRQFDGRLGFLDFETIGRAIPVWPDVGPWRQVVVQFSYHDRVEAASGACRHQAYLAEGPGDPREELALRLLEATADAERIVMYSSFERTRIRELAGWLPHLAADLGALEGKLVDLLPVIQHHVYHPRFKGSFSIKKVLNPMVPDLTYDDLTIVDGQVASVEIARLLFVVHKVRDRDQLRRDLLAYCERDTWAMVRLLERLREISS